MSDNYVLALLSGIKQAESRKQINADIKQLEKTINMLRLTATLAKGNSKKEINAYINTLSNQLSTIKLKAKIDSKNLKSEINSALSKVSFKDIDALDIDGNKTKLKVQKVIADAKSYAEKNPISIGINYENRRNKLDNDLTAYLNRNTKIEESAVLLEEAEKVRELISTINDKKSLRDATNAFQLYQSEVSATGFATKSTAEKIKNMLSHISKISSAFGIASLAVNNFVKSLKTLRSNDTILTEISKTSEMSKKQLKELGDEAFKTASKYGQLSSNYLLGVQEMARSGYEDMSKELGKLSLLAQSAGDMTADSANNYLLATDAAYKYGGSIEKLIAALDGASYISNKNSAALTDIADAVHVSASFAANAGVAVEELTAAEATMIAVTKRSGPEIGRAFRSIVLNLQQVSGEFDGEIIDEEQLKKVEERCHSLGVELEYMKDGIATLRNPIDILKDLAEVYNSLPDNSDEKQGLIADLGGKYHANSLSALLSRWDLYEKMLSEFSQGVGSALEEAEKTANSWEGRLNSLQNSWDSFINTLTNKEAIMGGVSLFDRLIQGAETLTNAIGEIPVVLATLNTAMVAMKKDYGITQLVNKETKKLDLQGNLMGVDFSAIKEQKKHFEDASIAISDWNCELTKGKTDLDSFNNEVIKKSVSLKTYLSTCTKDAPASLAGYKAHLNAAGVSTDALRLKTILLNSVISMGIGAAIQVAVEGIAYLIQRQENLRQATEEAADAYKESASSIEDYVSRYEELHKALIAAKGNEEETYSVKKQLLELQTELNDKFGEECGTVDLVTNAYESQTKAIKALNKEKAQSFLNENKEGIDKAEEEMTKEDRHYNLSYTGLVGNTEKGEALKEIVEKYKEQGMTLLDEYGDGTYLQFSIHLNADAQSAYETINAFENDLRDKAKELGNEHMFDDVLDVSSDSLNEAKETIEKYGDIYKQALTAEIVSDDDKSKTYGEALKAVEAYNEAVLKSENPYDDQNVTQAKENLDAVKTSIQDNEEEWGKYSVLFDDVFNQADTRLLEFNEALKTDSGLKVLADELEGLSDIDLQALDENVGGNASFDKLKEAAAEYKINVDELIDALVRLGYVQGEIENRKDMSDRAGAVSTISDTIDQLNTRLKPAFDSLQSAYRTIFTDDGFDLNSIDILSTCDSIKSKLDEMSGLGLDVDYSAFENLVRVLRNTESTEQDVEKAFDSLAASITQAGLSGTEDFETMKAALDDLGVVNENIIAFQALAENTEALKESGLDLADASYAQLQAFAKEKLGAENAAQGVAILVYQQMLVADNPLDTMTSIQALASLGGKAAETAGILAELAQITAQINNLQSWMANNPGADTSLVEATLGGLERKAEKLKSQIYDGVDFGNAGGGKSAASKAGSKAADAYLEAFQKEYDHLKDLLDRGEISEAQYLNRLRSLYTRYFKDRKEYLDEYKKYESEYLTGMLDLHNKALSGISTLLGNKISAANDAKDSAISALEEEKEAAAEAYQAQIDAIEEEKDAIDDLIKEKDKKIDALNEEADAIQKAAETRKKNIDLQKEEYNLERMLNQRTTAVYKEGRGFVYETDTAGIRDAREKVKEAKEELEIDRLQREADLIQKEIDLLEEKKDALTEQQESIQKMLDESNKYYDNLIKQQEKMWDSMIKDMEQQKSRWEELADIQEVAEAYSAVQQVFGELGYSVEDVLNGSESAFEDFKSKYISLIHDVNNNSDFTDGLVYATGVAKENLGSFLEKTKETGTGIDELASKGEELNTVAEGMSSLSSTASDANTNLAETATKTDEVATNVGSISEGLNQISESGKVSGLAGEFDTLAESVGKVAQALGISESDTVGTLFQAMSNLNTLTLGNEGEGIIGQFTLLKTAITDIMETIGSAEEQTVGSLMSAIAQLNSITLDESIIAQFTNLKTAIDSVSSAISGGGGESSGGEGQGSVSGSKSKGGESGGKGEGGNNNSLTGAITSIGKTAAEVIGEPNAEGDGTVIGEFGSLETAVTDVTTAIGGGESEGGNEQRNGEEDSNNLTASITTLGEITEETLGEPGGDGVIGRFGEFKDVIAEANEQVTGIADGLNAINGTTAECTIKINIESDGFPSYAAGIALGAMNLESSEYNAKYEGNAHVSGTALVTGNWAVQTNENRALVGEAGYEIIVRNGRFFTVGDNGPEMFPIKRGDIVFNHEQSVELLKNGHTSGQGKAYADGTVGGRKILTKDGAILSPLQPGDKVYDMIQKFDAYLKRIDGNLDMLTPGSFYEHNRQINEVANFIANSSIVNNNRNVQPIVNQTFNITMPNVTDSTSAAALMNDLQTISIKKFQINW